MSAKAPLPYKNEDIQLVGHTTCGACPGGNIEYAPAEVKKNGAGDIYLAKGIKSITRLYPALFSLEGAVFSPLLFAGVLAGM
ncbi:CGGC domain-containing protein, partial [Desulfogranum mediterraneum]|uniref:CGGC domain-containing protein n=1 Tax=Desulfogranum mediterraneum TaxID=160661 RepID=UPI001AC00723